MEENHKTLLEEGQRNQSDSIFTEPRKSAMLHHGD